MSINSRAKIEEGGSANLTYYFSNCVLNKINFLLIDVWFGGAIISLGNLTLVEIIPDATLEAKRSKDCKSEAKFYEDSQWIKERLEA